MGHGITVECTNCNYQETFMLGVGMKYSSLLNVLALVSKQRRDRVIELYQNHDIHNVNYGHELFICSKCNTLAERFDFLITFDDDQIYRPYFRCSKCQTKITRFNGSIEDLECSTCREKALMHFESMLWD